MIRSDAVSRRPRLRARAQLPGLLIHCRPLCSRFPMGVRATTGFLQALLAFCVLGPLLGAAPATGQDIRLEAEDYTDSGDQGYDPILIKSCTDASGGFAVDGVDADGDYIVLRLELEGMRCVQTAMRSAGDVGLVRHFEVSINSVLPGAAPFVDTLRTLPGGGIG